MIVYACLNKQNGSKQEKLKVIHKAYNFSIDYEYFWKIQMLLKYFFIIFLFLKKDYRC